MFSIVILQFFVTDSATQQARLFLIGKDFPTYLTKRHPS